MYEIRKIRPNEVEDSLNLALEVFMQFEAPVYKREGVETFKKDIIENQEFIENCRAGICPIYAAFDGEEIVGIIGMRANKTHINLVFTKKEYHHKGIATAIFNYLLSDLLSENPDLKEITLNSSPYGKGFYLHTGFVPLSDEQELNGIRFTPMKYVIDRKRDTMNHCGTKTLETERLVLRKFRLDDAEDMFRNWASNPNVTKFLIWQPYTNVDDVKAYIQSCIDCYEKADYYNWVIEYKENGQVIGNISVVELKEHTRCTVIGYCIGEDYWRKGITSEAFSRVIEFLFEEVGVNRIESTHDVNNPNSGRVMTKCGLKYEGILRQTGVSNQGIFDCVVRSILKSEWQRNG